MLPIHHGAAVRKYWPLEAVLSILGAMLLSAVMWGQKPLYQADVRLIVTFAAVHLDATSLQMSSPEQRLAMARVRNYSRRAASPDVARAVIAKLRLPYVPAELSDRIHASTPLNTRYIEISVADTDRRRAARICDAVAAQLGAAARAETARAQKATPTGAKPPASGLAITIDKRVATTGPNRQYRWAYPVGGLLGGLVVGVGCAMLLAELAARRRRA